MGGACGTVEINGNVYLNFFSIIVKVNSVLKRLVQYRGSPDRNRVCSNEDVVNRVNKLLVL